MNDEGQDPSWPPSPVLRGLRIAGPVFEVIALVAAYQQREGLTVAAKALAVLAPPLVSWFGRRRHR